MHALFIETARSLDANDVLRAAGSRYLTDTIGYFCDAFQDETFVPALALLPHGRALAAYRGPWNNDLVVDLSEVYSDREQAARAAHEFAERQAERERGYQQAWQAGNLYAEKQEEKASLTREYRTLARQVRRHGPDCAPAMLEAAQMRLAAIRNAWEAADQQALLLRYGSHAEFGWWTGDKDLRAAFADGAKGA